MVDPNLREKAEKAVTEDAIETRKCPQCGARLPDITLYDIKTGKDAMCRSCKLVLKGRITESRKREMEEEERLSMEDERKQTLQKQMEDKKKYAKEKPKKRLRALAIVVGISLLAIDYFYISPYILDSWGHVEFFSFLTFIALLISGVLLIIPITIKAISFKMKLQRAITEVLESGTLVTDAFLSEKLNVPLWELGPTFEKVAQKKGFLSQLFNAQTYLTPHYISQFAALYGMHGDMGIVSETLATMYPFGLGKEELRQILDELIYLHDLCELKFDGGFTKHLKRFLYHRKYNPKIRKSAHDAYEAAVNWSKKLREEGRIVEAPTPKKVVIKRLGDSSKRRKKKKHK